MSSWGSMPSVSDTHVPPASVVLRSTPGMYPPIQPVESLTNVMVSRQENRSGITSWFQDSPASVDFSMSPSQPTAQPVVGDENFTAWRAWPRSTGFQLSPPSVVLMMTPSLQPVQPPTAHPWSESTKSTD